MTYKNGQTRLVKRNGKNVKEYHFDGVWAPHGSWAKPKNEVSNPAHYTDGKIEVIDFIEDKKLGFHLGNAVKYIARAGKKDPSKLIQDLEKAQWYLDRHICALRRDEIQTK